MAREGSRPYMNRHDNLKMVKRHETLGRVAIRQACPSTSFREQPWIGLAKFGTTHIWYEKNCVYIDILEPHERSGHDSMT